MSSNFNITQEFLGAASLVGQDTLSAPALLGAWPAYKAQWAWWDEPTYTGRDQGTSGKGAQGTKQLALPHSPIRRKALTPDWVRIKGALAMLTITYKLFLMGHLLWAAHSANACWLSVQCNMHSFWDALIKDRRSSNLKHGTNVTTEWGEKGSGDRPQHCPRY